MKKRRDGFAKILETNWQTQIARYYNHDKTDEQRKIRNEVIAEYEDLIALYKKHAGEELQIKEG